MTITPGPSTCTDRRVSITIANQKWPATDRAVVGDDILRVDEHYNTRAVWV